MSTVQNLGASFEAALEALLLDPTNGRVWDARPYGLNPDLTTGSPVGKRLMVPTSQSISHQNHTLLNEDEQPEWRFEVTHYGFWNVLSRETIYYSALPDVPVWVFSLYGSYIEPEYPLTDECLGIIHHAAKWVFPLRAAGDRRFFPRGIEMVKRDGWIYKSGWTGDHRNFHGNEEVTFENRTVWSARFHGGIINSV